MIYVELLICYLKLMLFHHYEKLALRIWTCNVPKTSKSARGKFDRSFTLFNWNKTVARTCLSDEKRSSVDKVIKVHPGFPREDAKLECTKLFLNPSKWARSFFLICFVSHVTTAVQSVFGWLEMLFRIDGLITGSIEFLFLNLKYRFKIRYTSRRLFSTNPSIDFQITLQIFLVLLPRYRA